MFMQQIELGEPCGFDTNPISIYNILKIKHDVTHTNTTQRIKSKVSWWCSKTPVDEKTEKGLFMLLYRVPASLITFSRKIFESPHSIDEATHSLLRIAGLLVIPWIL